MMFITSLFFRGYIFQGKKGQLEIHNAMLKQGLTQ